MVLVHTQNTRTWLWHTHIMPGYGVGEHKFVMPGHGVGTYTEPQGMVLADSNARGWCVPTCSMQLNGNFNMRTMMSFFCSPLNYSNTSPSLT